MKHWLQAARLRTLPLALSSIFMGGILAAERNGFNMVVATLCVVTTILLQVLSNFANDYGDTVNGKDTDLRQGPKRTVQTGVISVKQMRNAVILFSALSLFSGLMLLYVSLKNASIETFYTFLGVGVLSIIAAITYTAGKKPYGYAGLGDLSVLIFFGWVGVIGSTYLHDLNWDWLNLLPATSCGFFAIAVLNINNIRDIESDKATGKNSIPVQIGREAAIKYHIFLLVGGMLSAIVFTFLSYTGSLNWLFLIVLPFIFTNGKAVCTIKTSQELDPYLKQMAMSSLLFVVLFGLSRLL